MTDIAAFSQDLPDSPATQDMSPPDPSGSLGLAADAPAPAGNAPKLRTERPRKSTYKIDNAEIAARVCDFYINDDSDRTWEMEAHLQRTAKFRMWTEPKDWPWPDSSNAAIPDMMTHSLKVQDTLHNAVMTSRPSVIAKSVNKALKPKEEAVNNLLDYQFFVENQGERLVGELGDQFVNSPCVTVFVPWIKEERGVHQIRTIDPVPKGVWPQVYFQQQLNAAYPKKISRPTGNDDWSWQVLDDETKPTDAKAWFDVEFYTVGSGDDMRIEMDAVKMAVVFNGPRPIIKDYEDIVAPARCSNLQIPSPSNPGGAGHVVMVDYPSIDEIRRLVKSGFYDLVDADGMKKLGMATMDHGEGQDEKQQKDILQGVGVNDARSNAEAPDHNTLTRYTCFDIYDIDGDGVNEDVIWWVIKEEKMLLRARELTQVYPYHKPRRPFAEGCFLPVVGRRAGISLLEMMEGLHDVIKQFCDQTIDSGTITNVPFFFYRASSNMRPEIMRMSPGEGYPISDPKNDVVFPQMPQQGQSFGFNLVTLFGQWEEKLTNIGDLQLGRVPQGKSSALRTARGMNAVMGQGDARPERILRRFFMVIADIYMQMHELNRVFLPKDKQVRIIGVQSAAQEPYLTISGVDAIDGTFDFEFTANALNTSKEAIQESLQTLMATFINPIAIQMGVTNPDTVYRMFRDFAASLGQDKDKYLNPPTPESMVPKMFAEEALTLIMMGLHPEGQPAEDPQEHLMKIMDFANSPQFGHLTTTQVEIFKGYLVQLRQHIQAAMQKQQMMAAAQQFQQGAGQPGTPGPQGSAPINTSNPPLQKNEMLDESMPSAGGGGNPVAH